MARRRGPLRRLWDNLAARTVGYYLVLLGLVALVWRYLPEPGRALLLEPAGPNVPGLEFGRSGLQAAAEAGPGPVAEMYSAAVAMVVAALLTLPVAWLYILTRQKKGFRQSVVHTLIILAVVVGGVVVLVKNSLALAFSLAGIVAAVRFRNTLEDSKDAVYIFVATAVGLAAAVAPPVALAISLIYNTIILALWYTDFGRTSAVFEGGIAEQRLEAARQFAGRGTGFITKLDDEILKSLSPEQLDVIAERARKRRGQAAPDSEEEPEPDFDVLLRVRTRNATEARATVEPVLDDRLKKWRFSGVVPEADGVVVLEYAVRLRKKMTPNTLRDALQQLGSPHIIGVEAH
ncbi:MAG: DUF4956 domain-containing protein [Gemmatimonadetes bacterium]|nr:DUF4956 domain-containing protein [Gemmatimonadota bacterium]MBI2403584.1 DUF4956 domain-containing protein [Gemmatimonadota bacterium]